MEDNIKAGDVVRLKSGGPEMTVGAINGNKIAVCRWFLKDGTLGVKKFPLVALNLVKLN